MYVQYSTLKMDLENVFKQLNFTKNESKIYLFLLQGGISTTGPIMTKLGVSSSRVYVSLNNLEKNGLISKLLIDNKQHFQANNPKILIERVNNLKQETEKIIHKLQSIKQPEKETYAVVFKGLSGFKNFYNSIGEKYDGTDEILVIEFTKDINYPATVSNLILKLTEQRQKTKTPLRIIIDRKLRKTFGAIREKEKYIKIRYLEKNITFDSALTIYKDYVINILWDKQQPTIHLIRNAKIAKTYKQYFKFIWETGSK